MNPTTARAGATSTEGHASDRDALKAIDTIVETVADVSGRLAVLERLCELMQANESDDNNNQVDFGGEREHAFWHGLSQLAKDAGAVMGDIELQANVLYDKARTTDGAR